MGTDSIKKNPGENINDSDIDYSRADAMTDEEIEEAARRDEDAKPLTEDDIRKLKIRRPNQPKGK